MSDHFLIISHCFSPWVYVLLALLTWWACGFGGGPVGLVGLLVSGGFYDKSQTFRGPTCQGVLGLVFHRFPGTSIRPS